MMKRYLADLRAENIATVACDVNRATNDLPTNEILPLDLTPRDNEVMRSPWSC